MSHVTTIQYLYNSGFSLDLADCFLVIDYIQGPLHLPENKPIFFVVTHAHADHYSPKIFTLPGADRAFYVLSTDVEENEQVGKFIHLADTKEETARKKIIYDPKRTLRLAPGDHAFFQNIEWNAFASTDQGISLLFEVNEVSYFHAGDLNAWKWPNWPLEAQQKEVDDFLAILEEVARYPVDVLFAPLDPRLGQNADIGPLAFLDRLRPQMFVPMHFRDDPAITYRFKLDYQEKTKTFLTALQGSGQKVLVRS